MWLQTDAQYPYVGYDGEIEVSFMGYGSEELSRRRAEIGLYRLDADGSRTLIDKADHAMNLYYFMENPTPYITGIATLNTEGWAFTAGDYVIELELNPNSPYVGQNTDVLFEFTVEQHKSWDASLASLSVSGGTLKPAFDPDYPYYEVQVPYAKESVEITASPNHEAAAVDGTGVKTLEVGRNSFILTVTAEDGTQNNYWVHVIRGEPMPATVSVTTGTIVATLEAYLHITVTGEADVLNHTKAYLVADGERLWETDIVNGTGRMHIQEAPAEADSYKLIVVSSDDVVLADCDIDVTGYNYDIWTMETGVSEDGYLTLWFYEPVSARDGVFNNEVKVNGAAVGCYRKEDDHTILVTDVLYKDIPAGNNTFTVSGVKYPRLFPGYSFTFTAQLTKN